MQSVKKVIGYNPETGEPIFEEPQVEQVSETVPQSVQQVNPMNVEKRVVGYNPNTGEPIYQDVVVGPKPPKKSHKGLIITLIVLLFVLIAAGLTTWLIMSNKDSDDSDEPKTEQKTNNNNNKPSNSGSGEWESSYEYSEDALKDGDYSGSLETKANIDEKVIMDKNDVKITAKRIRYRYENTYLMLVIENNTKEDIIVRTNNFTINDILVDAFMYTDISAGKKALTYIIIEDDSLVDSNIKTISNMEFDIEVKKDNYDSETLFTYNNIKLTTDAKDYKQEYAEGKELLLEQNNIKIYSNGVDNELDSIWGKRMLYFIENDNDFAVKIYIDECEINGKDLGWSASMSVEIPPHKKAYDFGYVSESNLEKYNIDNIENIKISFNVYKGEDGNDKYFTSDKIEYDA